MRIVLLSDTHGYHDEIDVPPGDLLIHAGDFTRLGPEVMLSGIALSLTESFLPEKSVKAKNARR